MDLMYLLILILLIVIIFKLSRLDDKISKLERLLKKEQPLVKQEKKQSISKKLASVKKENPSTEIFLSKPKEKKASKFKEYFASISIEELLFGNIILKIAIVAFILGIGLFLKYSIDKDWIPIWGRVLIGIVVGMAMLVGGIRMIGNRHKLFSEGLFGGGIAVLYLSIFSAFALEGFKFIDVNFAFVAMIIITILAGLISIRFDAKSTAIFGLIGGFATPFLLSTDSGNYVGLLTYMLMLNLGVLYISIYKNWSLLAWMAFSITALTQLATVEETQNNFLMLLILFALFFIIYSIVPFISEIKEKKERLEKSSVFLFWANFIVAILSFLLLFQHYEIELVYYAGVTVVLAGYLLVYATLLSRKNILLKNLFYIVLAQSIALLLVTPAFIFSGSSLTIVWAVESLMLVWIATKSSEETYGLFGLFGFVVTVGRYLVFDILRQMDALIDYNDALLLEYVQNLAITSFFVFGALFAGYKLLKNNSFSFDYCSNKLIHLVLFIVSFFGAYLIVTFITVLLFNLYHIDIFSIFYMFIILFFVLLFYKSAYGKCSSFVYYLFIGLLALGFVDNIMSISSTNTMLSLFNFLVFMAVLGVIYTISFKGSSSKIATYKVSDIMLSTGVALLFLFLNVEVYHVVKLYDATATKFAITLLWIVFGIALFVYGILKDIKHSKLVGTVLIFIAIIKAFFVDLANLDSIYRIILFLILGAILFGLSYFYQSKQTGMNKEKE